MANGPRHAGKQQQQHEAADSEEWPGIRRITRRKYMALGNPRVMVMRAKADRLARSRPNFTPP